MKTVLNLLQEDNFELSPMDSLKYNVEDHPDYLKGDNGKNRPKATRIYSLHSANVKHNYGLAQCRDAWGGIHNETVTLSELVPYTK